MIQLALLTAAFVDFALGIFVLANNKRLRLFRLYFIFSLLSAIWILANALSMKELIHPSRDVMLLAGRSITPFSLFATFSFLLFLVYFARGSLHRVYRILFAPIAAVSLLSYTDLNVYVSAAGTLELGPLYPFYVVLLLVCAVSMFLALYRNPVNLTPRRRVQLNYLKIGAFTTLIPAIGFGAVLPLFSDSSLVNLAPLFSLAFLSFAGFAIVKHRLFDIRIIVVRSIAYMMTITTVLLLYAVLVSLLVAGLFDGPRIALGMQLVYILLAIILGMTFQPIKNFFDKVTSRVFYRDAYNTQDVLDELSSALVSTVDTNRLLRVSSSIICGALKPQFLNVTVKEDGAWSEKFSSVQKPLNRTEMNHIMRLAEQVKEEVIMLDLLDDDTYPELREVMLKNNVAIVARLASSHDLVGYLLFGHKQNGSGYTGQDENLVRIVCDELAIAVQNTLSVHAVKKMNVSLERRIEEATSELRTSNQQLRRLDAAKDEFVSMASHQLRTPLTSVKGYISMVLEGDAGAVTPAQRQLLEEAFTSSERMVHLISDFLNVSRLQTGKFVIEKAPINLAELVKQEVDSLASTADAHLLKLRYRKPSYFPTLYIDEGKIRQVVMNFIDNAIYYSPEHSAIAVTLAIEDGSAVFTVRDSGIGVPEAQQAHLFTKFFRADNARRQRPDGTGVGLFLAKKVIVAHGGSMVFESVEGEGSTFGFRLPIKKLSEAPAKEPEPVKVSVRS